jgi:uncharacterized protein (TIGR02266 family)
MKAQECQRAARIKWKAEQPENKRKTPRCSVELEVSIHTEHNFYTGITENISEGGVFVATHERIPLGTDLELSISLPDHPMIQVIGEVRWIRELSEFTSDFSPGIGVQFINLSLADRKAIEKFIVKRSSLLYET